MTDFKESFPAGSAVVISPHQKLCTAGPQTGVLQIDGSEESIRGNWGELVLVAGGSSGMLSGLIPELRQRISPCRAQHSCSGLQEVSRQEMLWVEQEHSLEQLLSVYQLSPTCGTWACNRNLEARDRLAPHTPRTPGEAGFTQCLPPSQPSLSLLALGLLLSPQDWPALFLLPPNL